MAEAVDTKDDSKYLGVDAKRVAQTGRGVRSGRRILVKEKNPLTEVKVGRIDHFQYSEQDFRSNASSSLWKEYLLDKKPVSGVLLDNNLLIWFPARQELFGQKTAELAREKYPDAKVVARFNFGERAVGMSSVDLAIRSNSEVFDNHINSLISYFGRSLDWQEGVRMSVFYADREKGSFEGNMQEYLVGH